MYLIRPAFLGLFVLFTAFARAQSTAPVLAQSVGAQTLIVGDAAVTLDLRNHFTVPGITGQVAQFDTVMGRFNVELRADVAPRHVANFLSYIQSNAYANSFFHRSATFDSGAISIIQGGGYRSVGGTNVSDIPKLAPVPLEYNLPNARGTLAAARTADINSATSEFYFNVRDNSTILNQGNGGGYTVFGRVIGNGMSVLDAIALLSRANAGGPFTELPVRNFSGGTPSAANLVIVNSVSAATLFPTGGGTSIVSFALQNSASNVVQATLSGSTLTLSPLAGGTATITIVANDDAGGSASTQFTVTVGAFMPVFAAQPTSQTVATGSTAVFNANATYATSYRWLRNGVEIPGATSSAFVINNASAANAGTYTSVATNAVGSVTSAAAVLTVADVAPVNVGRLINLSILTDAGAGAKALTVGAVIGPLSSPNTLPLVVRAVGPTLASAPFNVPGVLADPQMAFNISGITTPVATNDNWGGGAELAAAFTSVGAFALPAGSLDAAILRPAPGVTVGGYTVQVTGKGTAVGQVLAEIYDAIGTARTADSPRLINVSVLKTLDPGATLTAGFVLSGVSARTVLVRAIGPGLNVAPFNIGDAMTDPRLTLFNGAGEKVLENDNWGGATHLRAAGTAVGAFGVANSASGDAMLLVTLAPGNYTTQVTGVNGVGGTVIVEVYEVQ